MFLEVEVEVYGSFDEDYGGEPEKRRTKFFSCDRSEDKKNDGYMQSECAFENVGKSRVVAGRNIVTVLID